MSSTDAATGASTAARMSTPLPPAGAAAALAVRTAPPSTPDTDGVATADPVVLRVALALAESALCVGVMVNVHGAIYMLDGVCPRDGYCTGTIVSDEDGVPGNALVLADGVADGVTPCKRTCSSNRAKHEPGEPGHAAVFWTDTYRTHVPAALSRG